MKKILILILILAVSMEIITMATKGNNQVGNKPPVWSGGGGKGSNTLSQRPTKQDNEEDAFSGAQMGGAVVNPNGLGGGTAQNPVGQPDFGQGAGAGGGQEIPVWLQALLGAAQGGAMQMLPEQKDKDELARRRSDRLAPHLNNKNFNQLAPRTQGGAPFSSSYSGWGSGGRGGGGGGGGYGYDGGGYSDTPAWLNQYLNLNSWNI